MVHNLASLATALHSRLLSWVEKFINAQLKLSEAVYGKQNQISLFFYPSDSRDFDKARDFGDFGRLLQNTTCEAFHWLAGTSLITWEEAETRKERLKVFYPRAALNRSARINVCFEFCTIDNEKYFRAYLDFVLGPTGLLSKVSELGREESLVRRGQEVADVVGNVKQDGSLILNHFWGEETYVTADFLTDTTDFLHPEIVSAMVASSDETISSLFLTPLTPGGKLSDEEGEGHSQTGSQQSLSSQFQHWLASTISCLMTKEVNHVFCFDSRRDLPAQLEAWNVKELVLVRRNGFSRRLTFAELLTRYCFLAFNFDERVVATRKTAQLLMLRLGIDGVEFGKRKVFLKYYHSEYLAELFKTQYRRIVLVQSAARRYLARRRTEREKCARAARVMLKVGQRP